MTRARDPPGTGRYGMRQNGPESLWHCGADAAPVSGRAVVAARRAQQQPGIGGKRTDGALKECLYMPWEEVMCGVTPQRALG